MKKNFFSVFFNYSVKGAICPFETGVKNILQDGLFFYYCST